MTTDNTTQSNVASVLGAFSAAGAVTPAEAQQLAAINQALEQNPTFLADLQKANVVTALRHALEKRTENQSAFAQRWGKTRQYVSRIFNLDSRTNFTIDTITEAAVLLGMRATVQIHRPDQEVVLRSRSSIRNAYRSKPLISSAQKVTSQTNNSHAPSFADIGPLAA
jgi:predicted XRE-type DNA-binding protein